ncbi:MAG: hypothetical protein V7K94_10025 [Nostoc sp.]|uniref:hypothetical protein n=1 Tax=Nostoc sp. TaxID=1180 RepID=UPI002FF615E8
MSSFKMIGTRIVVVSPPCQALPDSQVVLFLPIAKVPCYTAIVPLYQCPIKSDRVEKCDRK